MINYISGLLVLIGAISSILSLQNGDFSSVSNGKPAGWQVTGQCKVLTGAGVKGKNAVEISCPGVGESSNLLQIISPKQEFTGHVRISAWIKCMGVEDGGDCCLWLDTILENGSAIWGKLGVPDRESRAWQHVSAIVNADTPVQELQIFLIVRNVKGKMLVSDVQLDDTPIEIQDLKVVQADDVTYDIRAIASSDAEWKLTANGKKGVLYKKSGHGKYVNERFVSRDTVQSVHLTAALKDRTVAATAKPVKHSVKGRLACWTQDSTERVFQDDLPPNNPIKTVSLQSARNDRESFQICLKPLNKTLKNVKVTVSDLTVQADKKSPGTAGQSRIKAADIDWFRVGYVWVAQPFEHPFAARKGSSWWPDPLLSPLVSFDIEQAQTQPLWFTVNVPANAVPGKYRGYVKIKADGVEQVSVPIDLDVYPAVIPDQGKIKTAFALMDCYLRKIYKTITPELRRAYTDYLLEHHLNPDDISRCDTPDVDEIEYADKKGLNAFNVLNAVEECKDPYSWICFSPIEAYGPKFTEDFLRRMEPAMSELKKRGLDNKAYVYGFDERGPEFLPIIHDLFAAIKEKYPSVHTLSTAWLPDKTDPMDYNIDWYVPLTSKYDKELAAKVRAKGGEMWWYICLGPNYPYANWLLENPLMEARVIWWQAYQQNVEGFLYWGLNVWLRENNTEVILDNAAPRINWSVTTGGDYRSLNGDGVMLYPGVKGPLGSTRLEAVRDGLEDFELLRLYEEQFGHEKMMDLTKDVSMGLVKYTRDKKKLDKVRFQILKSLK